MLKKAFTDFHPQPRHSRQLKSNRIRRSSSSKRRSAGRNSSSSSSSSWSWCLLKIKAHSVPQPSSKLNNNLDTRRSDCFFLHVGDVLLDSDIFGPSSFVCKLKTQTKFENYEAYIDLKMSLQRETQNCSHSCQTEALFLLINGCHDPRPSYRSALSWSFNCSVFPGPPGWTTHSEAHSPHL